MSADFPFIGAAAAATVNLPMFREYDWDFENDCFNLDGDGNMKLLEGNDALKIWILKALRTERFSYIAYTWRYGMELHKFIGKVLGVNERRSELRRAIIETLMVNPYIKSLNTVDFVESDNGKNLEINISITTIYGTFEL